MTFNYDSCPVLTARHIGLSMMGYHWTEDQKIKIDDQEAIDACLECFHPTCFYDCNGKKRRQEFGRWKD